MESNGLTFYIEGARAQNGHVLAHVLYAKLGKLISALNQFDRRRGGVNQRRADYQIIDAKKFNPTTLTLHAVPKVSGFDAAAFMQWSFQELEAVALGQHVDDCIDSGLANTLADLSDSPRETEGGRMWLEMRGREIKLDETFRANSLRLAGSRAAIERPAEWREGASFGSIVGYLSQVGDLEGETKLIITPTIGPEKVECIVLDADRDGVKQHIWNMVRVSGLLHYSKASPFPYRVDMKDIQMVAGAKRHLADMRGLFKGRPTSDIFLGRVDEFDQA